MGSPSRGCTKGPSAAVSTLGKVMLDPTTPPATKGESRGQRFLNPHAAKAIEIEDIDARVRQLEEADRSESKGRWALTDEVSVGDYRNSKRR